MTLQILKSDKNPAESVVNYLRGAIFLSKNAAATISVTLGGRSKQFEFPFGEKPGMKLEDGLYEITDFYQQITTQIDWVAAESMRYPATLSIFVQRKAKTDIAHVTIDSLDAMVNYEGHSE